MDGWMNGCVYVFFSPPCIARLYVGAAVVQATGEIILYLPLSPLYPTGVTSHE